MEQKRGLPLDNYRKTSTHLISGVCVAYYEFLGGTAFQMKRSADLLTSHHSRTSSVPLVSSSLATLACADPSMDHGGALRSSVVDLLRDWNHISGRPRQTWLRCRSTKHWFNNCLSWRTKSTAAWQSPQDKPHDDDDDDGDDDVAGNKRKQQARSVEAYSGENV